MTHSTYEFVRSANYADTVAASEQVAWTVDEVFGDRVIATAILERRQELRFIIVAGPSSSGKTTTTNKLAEHLEAGGVSGVVEEIQVFATKIRTGDNKEITVPNGSITSGSIVNYSAKDTRRVDLVFGIGYGDDIAKAKNILSQIVTGDERVLKDPAPTIAVAELADSSVNLVCRPWVKTGEYWPVLFDVTERVKLEFDRQDISIPFPQTDIHVHQAA